MTRSRKLVMLGGTLLSVAAAAWVLAPRSGGAARTVPADAPRELVAPGLVESTSDVVELGFEQPGRVVELPVAEGEHVKKGEVLARLDDRMAQARVARAEAALDAALARRDLAYRGARSSELRAADAEADAARAQAWERGAQHDRAVKLSGTNAIGSAEVDSAKGSAEAAKAQAAAAEARAELLHEGSRREQKREAVAEVAAAQADLDEARTYLSQMELRAPRDGVILRRYVEVGAEVTVTPPKVVMTLADVDNLQLRAEIDEADVGSVAVGQSGHATADAYGERRFSGKIARIMGELGRKKVVNDDPRARVDTRVLEVLFVLDEPVTPAGTKLPLGLRMDLHLPAK
jgi:multidrug resistance efflux pump